MKVDISHPSAIERQYHLTFKPETGNEEILLHFLLNNDYAPFQVNRDGDAEVIVPENQPLPTVHKLHQRHITKAGKKALRKAQKARWVKFKKLGKTPLAKKKTAKKRSFLRRSKIVSSFWARMSPEQRRVEMHRRRAIGEANKQARLNKEPTGQNATVIPVGVAS